MNRLVALALSMTLSFAAGAQALPPSVQSFASSGGSVTAARRPVFSGFADPGRVVVLSLDGRLMGRASPDADGQWSFVAPVELRDGAHLVGAWIDGTDPLGAGAVMRDLAVTACAASASCAGATPVCDAASSRCRACAHDDECAEGACSLRGDTRGMCVARPPALTSPQAGSALGGERRAVTGVASAPFATVAVLVDGREEGRAQADARGRFTYALSPSIERAWHDVSVAQVERGLVGPEGEARRFLAVACADDRDCGAGRCDLARFACR